MIEKYTRWRREAPLVPYADIDVLEQLKEMQEDTSKIEDAFYRSLSFGTGGLRGIIGAGENRMNVYTVARASQGIADYVNKTVQNGEKSIAIGYDSRLKSELFAATAAGVFAANGIKVHLYPHLAPTPALSFAVRYLECTAGVMITASHNPSVYNGYKVYESDGCQITDAAARDIFSCIEKTDMFSGIRYISKEQALRNGQISYIDESVETAYLSSVLSQSLSDDSDTKTDVSVVYTPLNGTGLSFVVRALEMAGFTKVIAVKEQSTPDGNFSTCPYPNPEFPAALSLGLRDVRACEGDLLLATDPDCDRVGVAVKKTSGEYAVLSGNEVGILLLDYICQRRQAQRKMPKHPVCIKTVVTADTAELIALSYGVRTENVLTGFKYIGEKIGKMQKRGESNNFVFGFEESCGYLTGSYVRDKDGVLAALLISEMVAFYKGNGTGVYEHLQSLYEKYGYEKNALCSYEFPGREGGEKIKEIMALIRKGTDNVGGLRVLTVKDYAEGIDGLPPTNAVKLFLERGCTLTVRPSGTEPKIKIYLSAMAQTPVEAEERASRIKEYIAEIFC